MADDVTTTTSEAPATGATEKTASGGFSTPTATGNRDDSGGANAPGGNDSRSASETDLIKALRQEAAERRHENNRITQSLAAAQRELEEARGKMTRLEAAERDYKVKSVLGEAVSALRTPHAKAILRLADASLVRLDKAGNADKESVQAALNAVKAEHPQLFGASSALAGDGGAKSGAAAGAGGMNAIIRRSAGR